MLRSLMLSLLFSFFCLTAGAQYYLISDGSVVSCDGFFLDSGGNLGNYGPNESYTVSICPDGSTGTHTRLRFSGVDLKPGDELCFFDGPNILGTSLGCASDYQAGAPFILQASPTNFSGCLTIAFTSTSSGQGKGWIAEIECVAACQAFQAKINSTTPATVPVDTGWVDICPATTVSFSGGVDFLQNNLLYSQSDTLCTFEWDFGDGTLSHGINASHTYTKPGGYVVNLHIRDQLGCRNTNIVSRRVRVAPPPQISIGDLPGPVCYQDSLTLSAQIGAIGNADVRVIPQLSKFELMKIRSDSLALPDGNGASYSTSVYFTEFPSDKILTNPNDILSICTTIEHSWMRDLNISLTCPSGQTVTLVNQEESGDEVFLGDPFEGDELLPEPIPGQGYTYCWTADATNGTWLEYANANDPGTLPPGDYNSFEDLSMLIGCPLNGEWTLTIQDLWEIDNGFIFSWNISFDEVLLPNLETFTPAIDDLSWVDQPNIYLFKGKEIQATASNAGEILFNLTYEDAFQCAGDTFVTIQVLGPTDPSCFQCQPTIQVTPDTAVCAGDPISLAALTTGFTGMTIPYAAHPMKPVGYSTDPPPNPLATPILVDHVYPLNLSASAQEIKSVCFTLRTDPVNNINVYLEAPDGQQLELTTGNGGLGIDYTTTCFSPSAITPIQSGSAPFAGTYMPEGNWSDLSGSPLNGEWKLLVSDNFGINRMGLLENWSMELNASNQQTYSWIPSAAVSCQDCPNPAITSDSTRTYTVQSTDAYGCTTQASTTVTVHPIFDAPSLDCGEMENHILTVNWLAIPGATGYQVNVNQTGWTTPTTNLSHLINNLNNGDSITIQVKVIDADPACPSEIAVLGCRFLDCQMYAVVENTVPPSCHGGTDGEAFISAYDGTSPFTYNLDNQLSQGIGYFNSVSAGDHFVIVSDAMGCMDTVYFTLSEPDPIAIDIAIDSVKCYNQKNGGASAMAMGGTSPYQYVWFTVPAVFNPVLNNVKAGNYTLRITDDNGCIRDSVVNIPQPDPILLSFTTDSVSCPGKMDGTATVLPSGGTLPYNYLWSNLQITPQAIGLAMGTYSVTVTDDNACTTTGSVEVHEGPPNSYSVGAAAPGCHNGDDGQAWIDIIQSKMPVSFIWSDPLMQQTDTASMLVPGNYQVIASDGNGCMDTLQVTVPNTDSMLLGISSTPVGCQGNMDGTATVSVLSGGVPPFSFLWSDPGGQTGATATGLSPGIILVTVTDQNGCAQTASTMVGSPGGLQTQISSISSTCNNSQDGSASILVQGGNPPYTFLWNDPSSSIINPLTGLNPGTYTVTVTDNNGCTTIDSVQINAVAPLLIDSLVIQPISCHQGSDGAITAFVSGGSGIYSYQWSGPGSQSNNPATGLSAGLYSLTVTGSLGCQNTAQINLVDPAPLQINLIPQSSSCKGSADGRLTAQVSGGTPPYTYLWNDPGAQITEEATNLMAGTYTVTVTDAHLCSAVAVGTVNEPVIELSVTIVQTSTGCAGLFGNELTATASGGSGSGYQFLWNTTDQGSILGNIGPGNYAVTVTDNAGCQADTTVTASELPPVTISLAGTEPSCFGLSDGTIGVTQVSGGSGMGNPANYTYLWNSQPPQTGDLATGLPGDFVYTVMVTDPTGCTGVGSYSLQQPDAIMAQSILTPARCYGEANGSIFLDPITGGSGAYQITWDPAVPTTNGPLASDLAAGTYQVTISDDQGCAMTYAYAITQPDPLTIIDLVNSPTTCAGENDGSLSIQANGGTPGYQYVWSTGDVQSAINNLSPGLYGITITDQQGCLLSATYTVTSPAPLILTLDAQGPNCTNTNDGTIQATGSGGSSPYTYQLNGAGLQTIGLFGPLSAGTYQVTMMDASGCTVQESVDLTPPTAFTLDLGEDLTIELGESVPLTFTHNAPNPPFVFWRAPYDGTLDCTDCASPIATPTYTITYTLIGEDERGCEAIDQLTVFVKAIRTVLVPTAFTPNQDGQNDRLLVHGKDGAHIIVFKIFDRWGEQLYEQQDFPINDPVIGWDGTFKGQQMNSGVYIWTLEVEFIDGFRQLYSGQTTLLR